MSDNKQTKNGKAKEVIWWISVITTLHGMNDDNLWTFGRNTRINFAWFFVLVVVFCHSVSDTSSRAYTTFMSFFESWTRNGYYQLSEENVYQRSLH